jgi:hypothetical protein
MLAAFRAIANKENETVLNHTETLGSDLRVTGVTQRVAFGILFSETIIRFAAYSPDSIA